MTIFTKNDNIYPKNDGFLTLIVVKMTIYTDVRDRRSNVTNVRTSGKGSLVQQSRIVDVDNHALPWF